jgi:hypothetical protein
MHPCRDNGINMKIHPRHYMKNEFIISALTLLAVLFACIASTVVLSKDKMFDTNNIHLTGKHLRVSGSRNGKVSVFSKDPGQIRQTFNMLPGHVVRGLYLLSNETVLVGAQLGLSIFWDLQTGKRNFVLSQMILGFSPDRNKFMSFAESTLYIYDTETKYLKCSFPIPTSMGPADHRFSSDGKYLAVLIGTGWPVSDSLFPAQPTVIKAVKATLMYNLSICKKNETFPGYSIFTIGNFSQDSKYYELPNTIIYIPGNRDYVKGDWRFNLESNRIDIKSGDR